MRECPFCDRSATEHERHCVHNKPEFSEERILWKEWYDIGLVDTKAIRGPIEDNPIAILGYHKGQRERRKQNRQHQEHLAQMSHH